MRCFFRIALLCMMTLGVVQCARKEPGGSDPDSQVEPDPVPEPQGKTITITASLEQLNAPSGEMKLLWRTGDKIKVYNAGHTMGEVFTLSEGAGTTQGSFTGTELSGEGPFYAVYPASASAELQGSSIAINLPSKQTYADGGLSSGVAISAAKSSTLNALEFHNLLGGVSFSVSGGKSISAVRLQTKGDDAICGPAVLNMAGNTPSLEMGAAPDSPLCLDGIGPSSASFCLMLPPGTFSSGYLVEFIDTEGKAMFQSVSSQEYNTVRRAEIVGLPESSFEAQYQAAFFETDAFGFFTSVDASSTMDASLAFNEWDSQYAYKTGESRMVRIMSLSRGFYTEITTPKEMKLEERYDVGLSSVIGGTETALVTKQYIVLQKTADRVWLVNEAEGSGIIQKVED